MGKLRNGQIKHIAYDGQRLWKRASLDGTQGCLRIIILLKKKKKHLMIKKKNTGSMLSLYEQLK